MLSSRTIRSVLCFFLTLFVLVLTLFMFFWMSSDDMCRNRVIDETLPALDKKAVIFVRDCGTTTGYSTHLSILDCNEKLHDNSGNVFIAEADHGRAYQSAQGNLMI